MTCGTLARSAASSTLRVPSTLTCCIHASSRTGSTMNARCITMSGFTSSNQSETAASHTSSSRNVTFPTRGGFRSKPRMWLHQGLFWSSRHSTVAMYPEMPVTRTLRSLPHDRCARARLSSSTALGPRPRRYKRPARPRSTLLDTRSRAPVVGGCSRNAASIRGQSVLISGTSRSTCARPTGQSRPRPVSSHP
jgi:hypothetical protein